MYLIPQHLYHKSINIEGIFTIQMKEKWRQAAKYTHEGQVALTIRQNEDQCQIERKTQKKQDERHCAHK